MTQNLPAEVMSLVWSIGCVLQTNSRPEFGNYLRQLLYLGNGETTWPWQGIRCFIYLYMLRVDLFCCHYLYVEVLIGCMNIYIYVNVHLVCQYNLVYMEICRTASSGDPGEVWWPQLSCQGEHRTEFFWKSGLFRTRIREMRTNKLVVSWKHPAAWLRGNKVEGISSYKKMSPEFPERGSVFDWVFNGEVG